MSDFDVLTGRELSDLIANAYASMNRSDLARVLLVEYRCANRCLLLHAWQSPLGGFCYKPRYKLSPAKTESDSVPSAQAKRTEDGDRRWRSRGWLLDDDLTETDNIAVALQCDHVETSQSYYLLRRDVQAATPGSPIHRTF